MAQYPLEDAKAKEQTESTFNKPLDEAPSLDMSKIAIETKPAIKPIVPQPLVASQAEEMRFEPNPKTTIAR